MVPAKASCGCARIRPLGLLRTFPGATQRTKVLTVHDAAGLVAQAGHVVDRAALDLEAACAGCGPGRLGDADVVLLGLDGPRDGWDVLRRLRAVSDVPVLAVLPRYSERTMVYALNAGADDCMAAPVRPAELAARLRALARRPWRPATLVSDGYVELDPVRRTASASGREAALTSLEFRLLGTLMQHRDRFLSADDLLTLVWEDPTGVGQARVKTGVRRLRASMGWTGQDSPIETVRHVGYRYRTPEHPTAARQLSSVGSRFA